MFLVIASILANAYSILFYLERLREQVAIQIYSHTNLFCMQYRIIYNFLHYRMLACSLKLRAKALDRVQDKIDSTLYCFILIRN